LTTVEGKLPTGIALPGRPEFQVLDLGKSKSKKNKKRQTEKGGGDIISKKRASQVGGHSSCKLLLEQSREVTGGAWRKKWVLTGKRKKVHCVGLLMVVPRGKQMTGKKKARMSIRIIEDSSRGSEKE